MHHLDHLLHIYGYPVITVMLTLECAGILVPGETLMLAASLLASHGHLSIWRVIVAAAAGAALGNTGGYVIGRVLGHQLVGKYGNRIGLTPARMALGRYLFACHGGKMLFFGRFAAILRSFCPVLAGANDMRWRPFLIWTVAGAIAWPSIYCSTVFWLGSAAKRLSGPANIAFGVTALIAIVVVLWLAKRNETRLTQAALRWEHQQSA
jgi:membrane protein DedA with SNARE-associated domain